MAKRSQGGEPPERAFPVATEPAQTVDATGLATGAPEPTTTSASFPVKELITYGLPVALAAVTVLGIAGYAVGRAYLEGWYAGAGVSTLTFNWELQYLVLRGLSIDVLKFWMLLLFISAGAIILFSAFEASMEWLAGRLGRRKSSDRKPAASSSNAALRPHWRRFSNGVAIALLLMSVAGLWFVGAEVLLAPKRQGFEDFRTLFASATCLGSVASAPESRCAKEGERLGLYPWVEVRSPVLGTTTRGWLLQQQGGTLLLLSRAGVDVVTLGDSAFSVSNAFAALRPVTPQALRASAATYPQFKTESEGATQSGAPEHPTLSTATGSAAVPVGGKEQAASQASGLDSQQAATGHVPDAPAVQQGASAQPGRTPGSGSPLRR